MFEAGTSGATNQNQNNGNRSQESTNASMSSSNSDHSHDNGARLQRGTYTEDDLEHDLYLPEVTSPSQSRNFDRLNGSLGDFLVEDEDDGIKPPSP